MDEVLVLLVPVFLSSVCTPDLDNFLWAPLEESVRQHLTKATSGISKNCFKRPNPKKVWLTLISVEILCIGIWFPGTEIVLQVEETTQNNVSNEY